MPVETARPIKTFRDLIVWQRGMELVMESYRLARKLPETELYGLRAQIQRSAVSIPANIAEGHARRHAGDYLHHLSMAIGSLAELETHFEIALRLNYLSPPDLDLANRLISETGRMLFALVKKLQLKRG